MVDTAYIPIAKARGFTPLLIKQKAGETIVPTPLPHHVGAAIHWGHTALGLTHDPTIESSVVDTIVTEDDIPVDNLPSEKQQRLLRTDGTAVKV
ncbi:hypothetical protein [Candidatus Cyanaurora vandensis]|uniref:hypothetical protein n=1 Tax=Candidatus Cyanaurora vandensis TaxID=2714958 RepID=UPI00257B4B15|nr:hypothetical protein [Candidatus Cyanaurora vandensis]